MNDIIIDTGIIENFLSDDEISKILEYEKDVPATIDKDTSPQKLWHSELQTFIFENKYSDERFRTILEPKIKKYFPDTLVINDAHILTSYIPYTVHTDSRGSFGLPSDTYKSAWTFVIPLDNYDSATICFNEHGDDETWNPIDCFKKYNFMPNSTSIDKGTIDKYLSHIEPTLLPHLSIKDIFQWKKGSNFIAPRINFHCSDNFPTKNIPYKKAIIMWTTVPK